jgi:uroporphyrin-III C-methyltransferase/precorrin-2 dehydrogenase/sirohydrochlorin ferrochelatase
MDALARLPVFLALAGKRAMVAGGDAGAAWKAELLSAAGAEVDVFAPELADDLLVLAAEAPGGAIHLHRRSWTQSDFAGRAIAVGACGSDEEAARFAAAARAGSVPVNVIDKPEHCDFIFGAIVNRSPLVIGISTDGAAPVFGQAVRAKIESLMPRGFAAWADAARRWRSQVKQAGLSFRGRRLFWQFFSAHAVNHPDRAPARSDFDSLIARARSGEPAFEQGSVALVGAGPGDPELLTLRALRVLQAADVILFDDLVSPGILDFARREAKKMLVGKAGHGPSCKQDDINSLMVALAKGGKHVVRLKGGDPMIFGRAAEEMAACRAAGIPVEVVPGITAAQGAASRLAVPLTHRRHARRVQYVTGHGADGGLPADLDWRSIADPAATTVVYMPSKTLAEFVALAIAHGLDPATPTAAVARATWPDETVVTAKCEDLPARVAAEALRGPLLVLIGGVLSERVAKANDIEPNERIAVP